MRKQKYTWKHFRNSRAYELLETIGSIICAGITVTAIILILTLIGF